MKQSSSSTAALIAFLGGAIAGAAVALLFAPESGKETRQKIKRFAEDEQCKFKKTLDSIRTKVNEKRQQLGRVAEEIEQDIEEVEQLAQQVEQ